jgi:spore coat protein U-like protein
MYLRHKRMLRRKRTEEQEDSCFATGRLTMTIHTRSFRIVSVTALIAGAMVAQPALAATTTGTMAVNATVTSNCAVTATPVAFGNVNVTVLTDVDASGTFSVTCTNGTDWTASAGVGSGAGATLAVRKMTKGTDVLDYALYTDTERTTIWGDGVGGTTATVTGTGSGSAQSNTIYGRVPSGQTAALAGAYADSVTVTVTYL